LRSGWGSWSCGKHFKADSGRGNGADDEDSKGNSESQGGNTEWCEAAEIIGVTDRTMRRWRERYPEHAYSGLWDRRKQRPSRKRVPVKQLEQVLQQYREKYFNFNVRHFHEKLREQHGILFSYTWVKRRCRKRYGWPAQQARLASASGVRADPGPGCCCTTTAVKIAGSPTAGNTS
jgi:transposase